MKPHLPLWIKQILTEDKANSIFCPVRIGGALALLDFLGSAGYQLVARGVFDAMAFGTGAAALVGALGGGIGLKAKMEGPD